MLSQVDFRAASLVNLSRPLKDTHTHTHTHHFQRSCGVPDELKVKLFDEMDGRKTALSNCVNSSVSKGFKHFLQPAVAHPNLRHCSLPPVASMGSCSVQCLCGTPALFFRLPIIYACLIVHIQQKGVPTLMYNSNGCRYCAIS